MGGLDLERVVSPSWRVWFSQSFHPLSSTYFVTATSLHGMRGGRFVQVRSRGSCGLACDCASWTYGKHRSLIPPPLLHLAGHKLTNSHHRDLIRRAYAAIHSRGVVHGDLETRHIFFEPPSSLIPGSTPTSSTAMSTGGKCSTPNSHTLSLTSALPNSHVTIGMRVRIIDFDRAEIVNVGEAKVGVEREEEVLERLLRRGAGPAT